MALTVEQIVELGATGIGALNAYNGTEGTATKPWMAAGTEQGLEAANAAALGSFENGPQEYYPGQTVADQNSLITSGQDSQLSQLDQTKQLANLGGQANADLSQGGAARVGGFQMEEQVGFGIPKEYQNAIMNPIMNNLNNKVLPGLEGAATAQGAFGGSRAAQQKSDAAAQATEAATNAMIQGNLQARGQTIGQRTDDHNVMLKGREQDINQNSIENKAKAEGAAGTSRAIGDQFLPGSMEKAIGGERTAYDQSQIDADRARFDWNRQEGNDNIDRLLGRMGKGAGPSGGTVTSGQGGGWLDAITGGFAANNIYNQTK